MPWEPPELSTLQDNARLLHEIYQSMLKEGFTEHQAMHIVLGQPCCSYTWTPED